MAIFTEKYQEEFQKWQAFMNNKGVVVVSNVRPVDGSEVEEDNKIFEFDSGAVRTSEPMFDPEGFMSPVVIRAFSIYMEKHRTQANGNIRNSDNWQKGMSKARYMRSMTRHWLDVWTEWRSPSCSQEKLLDCLCALFFNVQGMMLQLLISLGRVESPAIRSEDVPKQQ